MRNTGSELIEDVSVALGNSVLVDHGETIDDEALGEVPEPGWSIPRPRQTLRPRDRPEPIPPRFRPLLADGPVTRRGTVLRTSSKAGCGAPSGCRSTPPRRRAAMTWRMADAVPAVRLGSVAGTDRTGRRAAICSTARDDGPALRRRDRGRRQRAGCALATTTHGRGPTAGTSVHRHLPRRQRVAGNVGADSIAHALTTDGRIDVRAQPVACRGAARRPETAAQVRRRAPQAFRTQERAVTPADYAEVTERLPACSGPLQACAGPAAGTRCSSRSTARAASRSTTPTPGPSIEHLERYRMAGHDLRVNDPMLVSLEIDLLVCVDDAYFPQRRPRGTARRARQRIRQRWHPRPVPPGQLQLRPDCLPEPPVRRGTYVAGVVSVQVTRFIRQGDDDPTPLADGFMRLDRLEIARLDNDPNFPEHGVLRLELHGGK